MAPLGNILWGLLLLSGMGTLVGITSSGKVEPVKSIYEGKIGRMACFVAPLLVSALVLTFAPNRATAQTNAEKPVPAATNVNQQTISIELRDAPIRKALERLFDAVKADFVIEGTIKTGTITARIKDK